MPLSLPQQLIVDHPARFKVVAAGRRFGKSYLSMNMMARTARHPMKNVWYVTTTYGAAKNIMWFPLKDRLKQLNWSKSFHEVAMQAHLVNGSVIALKGTNNPDSLRGVGLDYLVIDESAFIENHEQLYSEFLVNNDVGIFPWTKDDFEGEKPIGNPESLYNMSAWLFPKNFYLDVIKARDFRYVIPVLVRVPEIASSSLVDSYFQGNVKFRIYKESTQT